MRKINKPIVKAQKELPVISKNILLIRKLHGETQAEFGDRLGSNQKKIWTYEKGTKPGSEFLLALSKLTGLSPEVLTTVKLQVDKEGKFVDLPDVQQEIIKLYAEMNKIHTHFMQEVASMQKQIDVILSKVSSLVASELSNKISNKAPKKH